jgi:hypothetical protein
MPDQTVKARLLWIRQQRDHDLAALAETYHPRMRATYDEYAAKREAVWAEYDRKAAELRQAA